MNDWTHCHDPVLRAKGPRDQSSYTTVDGATQETLDDAIERLRAVCVQRRAAFDARLAKAAVDTERLVARSNRDAGVKGPIPMRVGEDLVPHFHGQCACGWIGLLTVDRGLAQLQHTEHACAMETASTVDGAQVRAPSAKLAAQGVSVTADDAEQRMALLELK